MKKQVNQSKKKEISKVLSGGDLRSIGKSMIIASNVKNQDDFNDLFNCLYDANRNVIMRAADAIEKITRNNTTYLIGHEKEILNLCETAGNIELKWHLAQLVARIKLTKRELLRGWQLLTKWATDRNESKIVRVNSLQSLYDIMKVNPELENELNLLINRIERDNIPSLNARIRSIRNAGR